ncbi:hypothetical protein ACIBI3_21625 [Actinomadura luteofluorescens]|uniref:hypothetical protein n=1 Tax=Actinomadura luteofluorescens TaxID=46163 RepID=UPI00346D99C7
MSAGALAAQTADRELAELRAQFNSTAAGGWGIMVDLRVSRWTAVRGIRGHNITIHAGSAAELRKLITSGHWTLTAADHRQ